MNERLPGEPNPYTQADNLVARIDTLLAEELDPHEQNAKLRGVHRQALSFFVKQNLGSVVDQIIGCHKINRAFGELNRMVRAETADELAALHQQVDPGFHDLLQRTVVLDEMLFSSPFPSTIIRYDL